MPRVSNSIVTTQCASRAQALQCSTSRGCEGGSLTSRGCEGGSLTAKKREYGQRMKGEDASLRLQRHYSVRAELKHNTSEPHESRSSTARRRDEEAKGRCERTQVESVTLASHLSVRFELELCTAHRTRWEPHRMKAGHGQRPEKEDASL